MYFVLYSNSSEYSNVVPVVVPLYPPTAARNLIEAETYTVPQATANTEDAVRTWLTGQITTLISGTGATFDSNGMNSLPGGYFYPAVAGSYPNVNGTNGSFAFNVKVAVNQSAKATGTITATPARTYAVTAQNDGGGTANVSAASAPAGAPITLSATASDGYLFKEWQVISGGVTIDDNNMFTMPANNVTVKAIFEPIPVTPVTTFTVTFDAGGGLVSPATATTGSDGKLASLPAPTKGGDYRFDGWFTAAGGGVPVRPRRFSRRTLRFLRTGHIYTFVRPQIMTKQSHPKSHRLLLRTTRSL